MAAVTTAAALATLAKLIIPLFGKKQGEINVNEELQKLIRQFNIELDPVVKAQARAGQVAGNRISQNLGTATGRAGVGLRTGVGAAARAVGTTVGGTRAIDAFGRGRANAISLANQALPSVIEGLKVNQGVTTRFQDLIAGLGQAGVAGGGDPLAGLLQGFFDLFGDDEGGSTTTQPAATRNAPPQTNVQRPGGQRIPGP